MEQIIKDIALFVALNFIFFVVIFEFMNRKTDGVINWEKLTFFGRIMFIALFPVVSIPFFINKFLIKAIVKEEYIENELREMNFHLSEEDYPTEEDYEMEDDYEIEDNVEDDEEDEVDEKLTE